MKKQLLFLFLLIFSFSGTFAQVASITPNTGARGQIIPTTITMTTGLMATSTAPYQWNDIYLQQGATIIYGVLTNWPSVFDPFLMRMVYADSGEVSFTIPANAPNGFYDVNVNTYPLNFPILNTLPNGFFIGTPAGTIQGSIYFDANQNGVREIGELPVSNQRVEFTPGNEVAFTNGLGEYTYYADSGIYVGDYMPGPTFSQTSVPLTYTDTVPPSVTGRDFGTYTLSNLYNSSSSILRTRYRCNLDQRLLVSLNNTGVLPVRHVTSIYTNNFPFVSATVPPDNVSGNTRTWITDTLGGGEVLILGGIMFHATPSAGNTVTVTMRDSIFDLSGVLLQVITDTYYSEVRCSYDPNDKHVSPEGVLSQHYTPIDSVLTFHINFQNTGNDTAYDVFILDTLDTDLDLTTFEVLASSHTLNTQMTPAGAIRFNFFNIMLPDSGADEPASHGYVTYRIRPKTSLPDPTVVTNTSYIIFDMNAPVITNTTLSTLTALQYPHSEFSVVDQSICETDCIQFNNESTSGTSYSWTFTGGVPATSSSATPAPVCYSTSGAFPVTLIVTNALGSDTLTQSTYISVATSPGIFAVTQSGDSLIAPQGYSSYEWYYNNVLITGDTLYYHVATQDGDYGVVVGNPNGCQSGVNIPNVIIGVEDMISAKDVELYPNPSNGMFEIEFNSFNSENISLSIVDKIGQLVYETKFKTHIGSNKIPVNNSDLSTGVYILRITGEKGSITKKLMISK